MRTRDRPAADFPKGRYDISHESSMKRMINLRESNLQLQYFIRRIYFLSANLDASFQSKVHIPRYPKWEAKHIFSVSKATSAFAFA